MFGLGAQGGNLSPLPLSRGGGDEEATLIAGIRSHRLKSEATFVFVTVKLAFLKGHKHVA